MLQMLKYRYYLIGLLLLISVFAGSLAAQPWELVREGDGIKVYTRQEAGTSVKAFKATGSVEAPAEKIYKLLEDVNHTEWWSAPISELKVLAYEKNKMARYYLVYDAPWPVNNRDLCVDVSVGIDRINGVYSVTAVTNPGFIPEKPDRVRILKYRQSWTVTSAGANLSNVVLEGLVDPAGNIPSWMANMVISKTPFNAITGVRMQMAMK